MPTAPETAATAPVDAFIGRWQSAEAAERANYQMYLTELTDLLGVPHPDPAGAENRFNRYVFDRAITRRKADGSETTVYADLYKRGCFILETKQGANAKVEAASSRLKKVEAASSRFLVREDKRQDAASTSHRKTGHGVRGTRQWDLSLEKAYNQARGYIRDLPAAEGRPPFLIVCDVGYVIELYSEFTCTGGTYIRYPDPQNHRIHLEDLRDPALRERLRLVWTDPHALDPSRHAARVTRDVAGHLARLARSLEADGHNPRTIATFLQRCLFTLFAEDVGLLPDNGFTELLEKIREHPEGFVPMVHALWREMSTGTDWSTVLLRKIAHFNGGLFENATALPLDAGQIALLLDAAQPDWSDVEPAIFGTLLERALSPEDRHKLGAHYTPRSYVERLVKPTIIDPLRERWDYAKTAAAQLEKQGDTDGAIRTVRDFHHELCRIRVLDPACGSGNFLYVTLEHMKRLEGEVLELLETLGDTELTFEMEQFKVRPQQFLGLELNERAVAIAQLVLWIGYFQWHKKTTGSADTQDRPLLPKDQSIHRQDAVLAYDGKDLRKVEAPSSRLKKVEAASCRLQKVEAASCRLQKVEAASSRLNPQSKENEEKRHPAASTLEGYRYFNPYSEVRISEANLPHWRQDEVTYFVTFRQADALPQEKLKTWTTERDEWLSRHPEPWSDEDRADYYDRFSARIEEWLDAGTGSCLLRDKENRDIVQAALRYFDGDRYRLGENCVAANHVHALVTPLSGHDISAILHSWKSFTATEINKRLNREGTFWQKESYDHIVRNPSAAWHIERYIRNHKVEAASSRLRNVEAASCRFPPEEKRQDAASTIVSTIVTIWDGRTTKPSPVTGREIPDESARIPVYDYHNPRRAEWPEADFIVGNPPFIGASRMRDALGDGYTEALREAWKGSVPESADFVMYWWDQAAELLKTGKIQRFGFITTNSIHQTFNRRVLEKHLNVEAASSRLKPKRQDAASTPIHLAFAIPDHPWVDTVDGAAVRIAMTVGAAKESAGQLNRVVGEEELSDGEKNVELQTGLGKIAANLKIGADLGSAVALKANGDLSNRGVQVIGNGFIIDEDRAGELDPDNTLSEQNLIRLYLNGRDLTDKPRNVLVIDLFGLAENEARQAAPSLYDHVLTTVKPSRDANKRATYRRKWWIHGEPRTELRKALVGLPRYIATVETSKHRFFQFLDASILPDNMLVNIASDNAAWLAVLSSSVHVTWALRQGGTLEDRPRYNKTRCFETFPFPDLADDHPLKARLRDLGEQLDAHRKRQQAAHPDLTMTGMYNVLEKLRTVEAASCRFNSHPAKRQDAASTPFLTQKERTIHEKGLVSTLKQLHDEIDAATLEAYGWEDLVKAASSRFSAESKRQDAASPSTNLADRLATNDEDSEQLEQKLLQRLVDLNHERAAEEAEGKIRWLRPEYQHPDFQESEDRSQDLGKQTELTGTEIQPTTGKPITEKLTWPKDLPAQVALVRRLSAQTAPTVEAITPLLEGRNTAKRKEQIAAILETLEVLGWG